MRTRAVVNILRKHVPGNPTIVVQHMAAGGGRQAANHVYKVAKPNSLAKIGSMGAALVANAVLGEPGVQYDIDKFIYLGTPDSTQHYLFITHRDSGFGNLEKLRAAPSVHIGSQSVGHPVYITGRIFAYFMGVTNSKFVTGYTGPELDLAITRREVDGRVTTGETMLVRSREWLDKGLVDVHAGIEIPQGEKESTLRSTAGTGKFCQDRRGEKIAGNVPRLQTGRAEFFPAARYAERSRADSSGCDAQDFERSGILQGIRKARRRHRVAAGARSAGKSHS